MDVNSGDDAADTCLIFCSMLIPPPLLCLAMGNSCTANVPLTSLVIGAMGDEEALGPARWCINDPRLEEGGAVLEEEEDAERFAERKFGWNEPKGMFANADGPRLTEGFLDCGMREVEWLRAREGTIGVAGGVKRGEASTEEDEE